MREERKEALRLVKENGYKLRDFPEFKNDKEVVKSAIEQNPFSFMYAGKELKEDKEFSIVACTESGYNLLYTSDKNKKDIEIASIAIKKTPDVVKQLPEKLVRELLVAVLCS